MRTEGYDELCPNKTGYSCTHSIDLYDEVATIARPPVEPLSKRPITDLTGYIVCVYRVFKGDDGEKFERNWLYWTGSDLFYIKSGSFPTSLFFIFIFSIQLTVKMGHSRPLFSLF